LGIPLVEIATGPHMHTPEQIKECALKLGEVLRACKVRRGIGTIRQDVNISIKNSDRVEIKAFQDPKIMIQTVDNEILRQIECVKNKSCQKEVRKCLPDATTEFLRPMPGQARMYPETDLPLLRISRDRMNALKKKLPKMKHEIRDELKKIGVSEELINLVIENLDEFQVLIKVYDKDANLVAKMIALWPNEFASRMKKGVLEIKAILNENILEKVLEALNEGKIAASDVKEILMKVASGIAVADALRVEKVSSDELEAQISEIVKDKPGLRANAYMGLVISKLGPNVDKRKAMKILGKIVK
jgi:Glu-tRNA(Gln) amidotransferase subunit E-like FAD-binding protein